VVTLEQRILSGRVRRPAVVKTIGDLNFGLSSASLMLEILPPPPKLSPQSIGLLWHDVKPPQGIEITVHSASDAYEFVKLGVECAAKFDGQWMTWHFVSHRTSELEGGVAVDALDRTSEDGMELWLAVPPHSTRAAVLEFNLALSDDIRVGDYPLAIEIVVDPEAKEPEAARFNLELQLRHPSSTLLQQLPAVYQDAMVGQALLGESEGDFLDLPFFERYLRGFDDFLEPLQETLNRLADLFGPDTTPPTMVLWLATWVCAPMDENWSEMKRRQLIKEAVDLFRWRGTKKGLARYLKIYTGADAIIDDQPSVGMVLSDHTFLGTDDTILGDIEPHTFDVTIAVDRIEEINEGIVREIIEFEKPAHTAYSLRIVGIN
jgi:phage tail-like protein